MAILCREVSVAGRHWADARHALHCYRNHCSRPRAPETANCPNRPARSQAAAAQAARPQDPDTSHCSGTAVRSADAVAAAPVGRLPDPDTSGCSAVRSTDAAPAAAAEPAPGVPVCPRRQDRAQGSAARRSRAIRVFTNSCSFFCSPEPPLGIVVRRGGASGGFRATKRAPPGCFRV